LGGGELSRPAKQLRPRRAPAQTRRGYFPATLQMELPRCSPSPSARQGHVCMHTHVFYVLCASCIAGCLQVHLLCVCPVYVHVCTFVQLHMYALVHHRMCSVHVHMHAHVACVYLVCGCAQVILRGFNSSLADGAEKFFTDDEMADLCAGLGGCQQVPLWQAGSVVQTHGPWSVVHCTAAHTAAFNDNPTNATQTQPTPLRPALCPDTDVRLFRLQVGVPRAS
jgi:hypothetical protein